MTSEGTPDPNSVPRSTDLLDPSQRHFEINAGCSGKVKKHPLDYAIFGASFVAAVAASFAAYYTESRVTIAKETSYAQLRPWVGVDVQLAGDLELKSDSYLLKLQYDPPLISQTPP